MLKLEGTFASRPKNPNLAVAQPIINSKEHHIIRPKPIPIVLIIGTIKVKNYPITLFMMCKIKI
ncbi:hypothetical protein BpHYR1_004946 [Brachionus plicatilis]|uniref:Uncharacterized protein n=1 Tax=Brachionus plicatilis TaxID=10195 RepID=A0A3M7Q6M1_BRAPC|nr:hypothetical protein BpHYR1_004946 [Brachionus plicatilis]